MSLKRFLKNLALKQPIYNDFLKFGWTDWIYVLWDHGTHNAYRYGDGGQFDVMQASHRPRILADSELIEVGVQVEKGKTVSIDTLGKIE